MGLRETFKVLYNFIRPYRIWLWISVISAILLAAADILGVYLIQVLVENVLEQKVGILVTIILVVLVIMVVGIVAEYFMRYASGRFGTFAIRDIRNNVSRHLSESNVSNIEKRHSGDLISNLTNDISAIEKFLINHFTFLIYLPVIIGISVIYLGLMNWLLFLVSYLIIPLFMYISYLISKPISGYSKSYYEAVASANSRMQDMVSGITVTKAYNLENEMYKKADETLFHAMRQGFKVSKQEAFMRPATVAIYELPFVMCAIIGGYLAIKGNLNVDELVAFLLVLRLVIHPTVLLPQLIGEFRSLTGAVDRLVKLLREPTERTDGNVFKVDCNVPVEIRNVSLEYESGQKILNNITFTLNKGETVALVGPSGTGKSTIINMICGFLIPGKGDINIFGHELRYWNLRALRDQIAIVSQDTFLFPGTIEENIRFGNLNATYEEIVAVSKISNSYNFINELPNGFNTEVGEWGVMLSGGQKQRISIARALLKDAPILLMDEPTSALDNETEAELQQLLKENSKNRTTLIVTHRLSSLKYVDRILVLENGRIVEQGTHAELMELNAVFNGLYEKQDIDLKIVDPSTRMGEEG